MPIENLFPFSRETTHNVRVANDVMSFVLGIFTDLDGTLLDHATYSYEAAKPALLRARHLSIPIVLVSSKTRAEIEALRSELENTAPFISENGGALFIPDAYFPFSIDRSVSCAGSIAIEFGEPYHKLVQILDDVSRESGCRTIGFHQMSVEEIAERCSLPVEQAMLAAKREYDEPFEILDVLRRAALLKAIEARGMRWTKGGRFYHITGNNDKGAAVRRLSELFRRQHKGFQSVGLGDSLNDIPMLKAVDIPVLIRSHSVGELRAVVPGARVSDLPGPQGWNEAVLDLLKTF